MNRKTLFLGTTLLGASLTLGPLPVQAQSFLNKLAEKIQQKAAPNNLPAGDTQSPLNAANTAGSTSTTGGKAQLSAEDARILEADRADTTLNKRATKQDKRGLSGIYYPNFLLGVASMNMEKGYAIGKVLIDYDDDTAIATLYTRYAFEANDPSKLVPKAVWMTGASPRYVKGLRNVERLVLTTPTADTKQNYKYMQQSYKIDLQGNEVPDSKTLPEGLGILLELEPGVLYVGTAPYAASGGKPFGHNLLRPGMAMPLLYKEGKAQAAESWNAQKIIAHYQQVTQAADRAAEEADAQADPNAALLPPADPAPVRGELEGAKTQWGKVITDRNVAGTQSQRKFTLVYVYPTSPWSDMRKKQFINNSWVDTVISRSRVYSATFTDQEGKYWNNRFYLVEKAPMGVYFGERWNGDYEYALPASAIPKAMNKEAAMKYQNAVKAK